MINNINISVFYKSRMHQYSLWLKIRNRAYKTHAEHQTVMSTGLVIPAAMWGKSGKDCWIRGTDDDSLQKNKMIRDMITGLERIYFAEKQRLGYEPTAIAVADAYRADVEKRNRPRKMLLQTITQYIEDKQLQGSTLRMYKHTLTATVTDYLRSKYKKEDIAIDDCDASFLYRFEIYLKHAAPRKKGDAEAYKPTTIRQYITHLLAILHFAKAIGETVHSSIAEFKPADAADNDKPVAGNIMSTLTEAVYWKIPPEDLYKIETTPVRGRSVKGDTETGTGNQNNYDLARPRLLFLLQSWTGFAYADLCAGKDVRQLIMTDLSGKKSIIYYRAKNGELAALPVFEQAQKLLEALDYNVVPGCSYSTFNRKIKALLNYYSIPRPEETVTHLGRHLFGSRMLNMNFSMEAISRMMGHTSMAMTESVYAKIDLKKVQSDYDRIQLTTNHLGNRIAI